MSQEWGRRRSDNQPYPKTRGKEELPSGLKVVPGTQRKELGKYIVQEYPRNSSTANLILEILDEIPPPSSNIDFVIKTSSRHSVMTYDNMIMFFVPRSLMRTLGATGRISVKGRQRNKEILTEMIFHETHHAENPSGRESLKRELDAQRFAIDETRKIYPDYKPRMSLEQVRERYGK